MFSEHGRVEMADIDFQNGKKSVRLHVDGGHAGIRQGRLFLDAGILFNNSPLLREA
jgi:alpha-N-arabinofuranosidase